MKNDAHSVYFAVYRPAFDMYVTHDKHGHSCMSPWSQDARRFESQADAEAHMAERDLINSTDARDVASAYVITLTEAPCPHWSEA